eukprot:8561797-Pyramimonas_sp.AAC.1
MQRAPWQEDGAAARRDSLQRGPGSRADTAGGRPREGSGVRFALANVEELPSGSDADPEEAKL